MRRRQESAIRGSEVRGSGRSRVAALAASMVRSNSTCAREALIDEYAAAR